MTCTKVLSFARRLANYINDLDGFSRVVEPPSTYGHLGCTIADTVLQAGLNYRNVVLPRVQRIKKTWPNSRFGSGFLEDLHYFGPHHILSWKHDEKPRRLLELTRFLVDSAVENETELLVWLNDAKNRQSLLRLRGIGPKSVDYMMRLVGGATIAIDRHVSNFVAAACPKCSGYEQTQRVVQYAADLLDIDRGTLDHAIWRYMAAAA